MNWVKKFILAFVVISVLLITGFRLFQEQIGWFVFDRVATARLGTSPSSDLPDGLHVYLCGTGSPLPSERAGACIGVLAGKDAFLFDVGDGGASILVRMGFPMNQLEALYLTHLHSDHIDGIGNLLVQAWVGGNRKTPLPIRGPVGTQKVVAGFNQAYQIDSTYRVAHHGTEIANPGGFGALAEEIILPNGPAGNRIILEEGDLKITAFGVDHSPVEPAMGYRIDYKDRSISISGDTVYDPRLIIASKDVDVLFHEALQKEMVQRMAEIAGEQGNESISTILYDILDYHTSPVEAAMAASQANAGKLILYHIVPPLPSPILYTAFLSDARNYFEGDIEIGEDGMLVSLPAGSTQVNTQQLLP